MEHKKKWINILGTEINPKLIRVYSLNDEGVSIQFHSGEWMHWKLSPDKAREVMHKIDNQLWGKPTENELKAERLRKEDDDERYQRYLKWIQQPKKPMTEAVRRMIAKRRPVNSWWMRQCMQPQAEN